MMWSCVALNPCGNHIVKSCIRSVNIPLAATTSSYFIFLVFSDLMSAGKEEEDIYFCLSVGGPTVCVPRKEEQAVKEYKSELTAMHCLLIHHTAPVVQRSNKFTRTKFRR